LGVHFPELASLPTPKNQAMLDMGTEVGEMARRRFPGGCLVKESHRQSSAALRRTAELIQNPNVSAIFEGAVEWQDTFIRADILERLNQKSWRLIEVKATARVKAIHLEDLAIQSAVLVGAGLSLVESCLMHLNTAYLYEGGEIDFTQLFTIENLTEMVWARQPEIRNRTVIMRQTLQASSPPVVAPDAHCHTPYPCPFWAHCTKDKPSRWVYFLPGSKQTFHRLTERGIESIDDIPSDFHLTVPQSRMKTNVEWISPKLLDVLDSIHYPVHHLDFETFMSPIPPFPGIQPYRPIPMQWSNHIEEKDGAIRHESYLCTEAKDPREAVANTVLASLGEEGSICVYSENERHLLLSLADRFPHLKTALTRVANRLWDLLFVIQNYYYHPAFQNSFSIKSVLPALVPSLGYEDLEIQNGAVASLSYRKMVYEETDWVERAKLATAMSHYCERDTWGMVELRRVLREKAIAQTSHTRKTSHGT